MTRQPIVAALFLSTLLFLSCGNGGAMSVKPQSSDKPTFRPPKIAVFSGSARQGSVNTQLALAAAKLAKNLGAETNILDLGNYDLPLYNQDDESNNGMPPDALKLKEQLADADGWIVASPEYNGFVPPLIVNAYCWASRGDPKGQMYATFKGKFAIVLSASPGAMGGMRSLQPHTYLLQSCGVNVLPNSVAVGGAYKNAFDETTGGLTNERHKSMLANAVESLFYVCRDAANRDATCEMIRSVTNVGEYGNVDVAE